MTEANDPVVPMRHFDRYLSEAALAAIKSCEPLRRLLQEVITGPLNRPDGKTVDLHFRERNKLMFYVGLTRPLVLRFIDGRQRVTLTASPAYQDQVQALNQHAPYDCMHEHVDSWRQYLLSVPVADQYWTSEGWVQNSLSLKLGSHVSKDGHVSIDREAVIGFVDAAARDDHWGPIQRRTRQFAERLQQDNRWARPPAFGNELDSLLWDRSSQTLLIAEVKNGQHGGGGVYYGPLQTMAYYHAWANFMNSHPCELWRGLTTLVTQKRTLGLLPNNLNWPDTPSEVKIRPALVIAELIPQGATRDRLFKVADEAKSWCRSHDYPSMDDLLILDWDGDKLSKIPRECE